MLLRVTKEDTGTSPDRCTDAAILRFQTWMRLTAPLYGIPLTPPKPPLKGPKEGGK